MNGLHRMVRVVWVLFCCFGYVSVEAGVYRPTDLRTVSRDLQRFKMEATYYVEKTATQQTNPFGTMPKNKALTVVTGKDTIGDIARSAKKGTALNVAVVAAVAGAGWAIDELTGQIGVPVVKEIDPNDQWGHPNDRWCTAAGTCTDDPYSYYLQTIDTGTYPVVELMTQTFYETSQYMKFRYSRCGSSCGWLYIDNVWNRVSGSGDPETEITPVTDAQFDEEIIPRLTKVPGYVWDKEFKDSAGRPKMTPELQEALHNWHEELAERDPYLTYDRNTGKFTYSPPPEVEGDPAPDPIDYDAMPDPPAAEDEWDEPQPGEDWPSFCTWAEYVCIWIDWTQEEPEPEDLEPDEMPVDHINLDDFRRSYNSGLGGGSCPASVTTSMQGHSITYDYQPACTAMNYIRPILITAAGVIAAIIIAGTGRRAF